MPELKINGYTFATQADGNNPVLASNVTFPAGHVIQVVHKQTSNLQTISSGSSSWVVIGGTSGQVSAGGGFNDTLETSFIPKRPDSFLIIQFKVEIGAGDAGANGGHIAVCLDGVPINIPTWSGNHTKAHSGLDAGKNSGIGQYNTQPTSGMTFYDAYTTTAALNLSIRGNFRSDTPNPAEFFRINYPETTDNGSYAGRYISNMLIMEVA